MIHWLQYRLDGPSIRLKAHICYGKKVLEVQKSNARSHLCGIWKQHWHQPEVAAALLDVFSLDLD